MIPAAPPRWMERMLRLFLLSRDRETISGDLLEEYREERLPRLGSMRANLWYLRQSISLASIRVTGGAHMKQALMLMSVFTAAAGIWLVVMENILKHSGYPVRSAIDVCIAIQGAATLLFLIFDGRAIFRWLVIAGAVAIGLVGARAIGRILQAQHFEGFVLIIGFALLVQAVLTLVVLIQARHSSTA